MKIERFKFRITGLTPLMQRCSENAELDQGGIKTAKKLSPLETATRNVWQDKQGPFHPAIAFRSAILYAAGGKKIGKRSARAALAGMIFVGNEKMRLTQAGNNKPATWVIDKRPVVTSQDKMLFDYRPKFESWGGVLELDVDTDMLPDIQGVLLPILNEAGTICGVGSFRVERGGWFGRFSAELC